MNLWLLLALAFILQEPVTTSGILLTAYQAHYNIWLIHLLFVVTTLFDIVVGYYLGVLLEKKFRHTRLFSYVKSKFEMISGFIGKKGKIVALVLFIPTVFPLSSPFMPWLGISLLESLIWTFIGELVFWYGYEWLLVLGVGSIAQGTHIALYAVIGISLAVSIGLRFVWKKAQKKQKDATKTDQ